MKKVYIPFIGNHDPTPLESFGTLVPVTNRPLNPTGVVGISRLVSECFLTYPPEVGDYLVACGHQVLVAILALELASRFKKVNFLVFDAKQQVYLERVINAPLALTEECQPTA